MPQKTKEERKAYDKEYAKTPARKKSKRIAKWKYQGIIVEDWNTFYDYFLSITNCQLCKKELTTDRYPTHSTKCVDHDHTITDRPNVRGIICNACNVNDRSDNTSGEPNISYDKRRGTWYFQKNIQGKKYSKSGFKTKEEAINYKKDFLASTLSVKET